MAKRPTLSDVTSSNGSAALFNANWDAIQSAFDNTVSRDGSTPNQMTADLDLNSNDIINAGSISASGLTIAGQAVTLTATTLTAAQTARLGYATKAAAAGSTIPESEDVVIVRGHTAEGDAPLSVYKSVVSEPSHVGKFTDAGGRFWELVFDDYTDVRKLGVFGSGSDESSELNSAIGTTQNLWIPEGMEIRVSDPITGFTDFQRIFGKGTIKKLGTDVEAVISLPDESEGVWFDGITIDGLKDSFSAANGVPGILGHLTKSLKCTNVTFQNIIDSGIKLRDGAGLFVDGCTFSFTQENGIELRNYVNDPRTASPYTGTRPAVEGNHQIINSKFLNIGRKEDGASGLVDGCAVTMDSINSAYVVTNVVLSNNIVQDCLRGFWTEANVTNCQTTNLQIVGNTFRGDVLGAVDGGWGKYSVGLIGAIGATVTGNSFLNTANYLYGTDEFSSLVLSGVSGAANTDVIVSGNTFRETQGDASRTAYGIDVRQYGASARVIIENNTFTGYRLANIRVDSSSQEVTCSNNPGAEGQYSWSNLIDYDFVYDAVPANGTWNLVLKDFSAETEFPALADMRLVGVVAKLTSSISAGGIDIKVYLNGSEFSTLNIDETDFGGGTTASKRVDTSQGAGQLISADQLVRVDAVTDASFSPTTSDLIVKLMFSLAAS